VGAVPADLVLVCGVFGNISDDDVKTTVLALPTLCAHGGTVIWTRHRREPDLTGAIRTWFKEAGFVERAFVAIVDSAVMVCADFENGSDFRSGKRLQPDAEVRKVVGANGEALANSAQALRFIGPKPSYWLEVRDRLVTWSPLAGLIGSHQKTQPRMARLAGRSC
jgi:hypothetical protein